MFINLIGNRDNIIIAAEFGDEHKLAFRKYLAGGVIGAVDYECPCFLSESRFPCLLIEREIIPERRKTRNCPVDLRIGAIIFIEWFRHNHFITGLDNREHGRHHRFGGTTRDRYFCVRMKGHAVIFFTLAESASRRSCAPHVMAYWFMSSLSLIHISEPTRRTPISYAVFCLKK